MKEKRISFDVPSETPSKIAFKTDDEYRKAEFHGMLLQGFHESYEGKGREITDEDMERWKKMIDEF